MKRTFFRIAAAIALAASAAVQLWAQQPTAAPPPSQKLGVDPAVIMGTLPNGVRYYIRKNAEPAKRAELRLVVNAGSVLETDAQRGYAHFIEHTAFNGTTHFKKNDLVKYLESIGVRFGADLNAYTDFDETVYQLSVPTDTARLVEQAFLILEDWAHGQVFDSAEVVGERGVVHEEWRGRLGAGARMLDAAIPVILKGSRYAERLPIGTEESIMQVQPSGLRRFYQDWYRADLMAVIAVGDFDVGTVQNLITQHFSGIPRATNSPPRPKEPVPGNAAPLVAITQDLEATTSSIEIDIKHQAHVVATVGDYRRQLAERLYFDIINARLRELAQKPDAPFLNARVSSGGFIGREVDAMTFSVVVRDGGIERGTEAVLVEARRVDQHGFLNSELQRARDNTLRSYERMHAERAKTNSTLFVDELARNFLQQEDIPGIEAEYRLAQQLLPAITLEEVNTLARDWITDENRVIWASSPRKAGLAVPTEAQILAVMDRASKAPVTAYAEALTDAPLLEHVAPPGRVVSTRKIEAVNVTEWKLSNGVRVLAKPTDFKADEIVFSSYSPGGTSLVPDADYVSAYFASTIIGLSGMGSLSAVDLGKKLAGKAAGVNASLGPTSEGLAGTASPKDIETLFQLIYLRFTASRLDMNAFQAWKRGVEAQLANRDANPFTALSDTLTLTLSRNHFRARPMTTSVFAEVDPEKALRIYQDRFSNAGDFTFVFVGSFSLDSLKPLVEKYLGSLPNTKRVETWKDVGDSLPTGVINKTVRKGTEPVALTVLAFTGPMKWTPQDRFDLLALTTLGQIWVTDKLREQLGGTYSPAFGSQPSREPRQEYTAFVQYQSAPENVDKLEASFLSIVDSLKTVGPSDADLTKVKEQIIRSRETSVRTNAFWVGNIANRDQSGEDIAGLLAPYDEMVRTLSAQQLRDAAKRYLDTNRYVRVVLVPEKKAQ